MLSQFTFSDFYGEEKLNEVKNANSFLYALLSFNKFNKTQIQKLSFLAFAENDILLPFKFIKHNHGPFSGELTETLDKLKSDHKIEEKIINHSWGHEDVYNISSSTQEEIKNDKEINHLKVLIKDLVETFDMNAKSLERYCYNNYLLKYKGQDKSEWESKVKNKINDLLILLEERIDDLKRIDDLEESKKMVVLSSFDYIENLLKRLFSNMAIDQIIRGVLIKKVEEYINLWGEILRLAEENNTQQIKTLLEKSKKIFYFLNRSSEMYGVFESVFESQEIETS